jgi:hypothetical protein
VFRAKQSHNSLSRARKNRRTRKFVERRSVFRAKQSHNTPSRARKNRRTRKFVDRRSVFRAEQSHKICNADNYSKIATTLSKGQKTNIIVYNYPYSLRKGENKAIPVTGCEGP